MIVRNSAGDLYLYRGNGANDHYHASPARRLISAFAPAQDRLNRSRHVSCWHSALDKDLITWQDCVAVPLR